MTYAKYVREVRIPDVLLEHAAGPFHPVTETGLDWVASGVLILLPNPEDGRITYDRILDTLGRLNRAPHHVQRIVVSNRIYSHLQRDNLVYFVKDLLPTLLNVELSPIGDLDVMALHFLPDSDIRDDEVTT